jgi:hypothetical protein
MTRPPELSGGLPWLGHALEFRRNPVALLGRGRARFGDVFSFRLAGSRVTALTGPRAQAAFFQAPDDQLSAREVYRFMIPIFGRGVAYDAVPEVMDEQMGFFFPALREERLQAYAQRDAGRGRALLSRVGRVGEIDLLAAMNELTVFIAGRCLVGDAFRQSLSREFAELYRDLEGGINLLAFVNPVPAAAVPPAPRPSAPPGGGADRPARQRAARRGRRGGGLSPDAAGGPLLGWERARRRDHHRSPPRHRVRRPAHQRDPEHLDRSLALPAPEHLAPCAPSKPRCSGPARR